MKIGVTGTRTGMNEWQFEQLSSFLTTVFIPGAELHHGDCVGVDVEAGELARELGYTIVCHPPTNHKLRAYHNGDKIHEPFGYLARDRNIVDATEMLLVVPLQVKWSSQGGTWFTHDYAIKQNKPLKIFFPK